MTIRALIIEDDLFINKLLQEALEAKAIDVRCCKNGADAKNYLNEENFELIITDILMPQVDGIEISKFIKEIDNQEIKPSMIQPIKDINNIIINVFFTVLL